MTILGIDEQLDSVGPCQIRLELWSWLTSQLVTIGGLTVVALVEVQAVSDEEVPK